MSLAPKMPVPDIPVSKSGERAIDVAAAVAAEADALLAKHARRTRQVTFKGRGNIVTEVDNKSEKLTIGRLIEEFPGFGGPGRRIG